MSHSLRVGDPAPRIDLPGIPARFDSLRYRGSILIIEFIRGTW